MGTRIVSALVAFLLLVGSVPVLSQGQTSGDAFPFTFTGYHSYNDVKAELENITAEYDEITSLRILGQTWEGRDIMAMRVSDNPNVEEVDEPDVLIMGGHHANELPSVEVPMYILEFLVGNYSTNGTVRRLVDTRDIWFVPMVNPDGRDYALMTGSVTWRKNRRPIDLDGDGSPEGWGVDLNRNYDFHWGMQGTSHLPTDSMYCGPGPFSENETRAIRDLAAEQWFDLSLSYHTYGQKIYYPWGNTIETTSPRKDLLENISAEMAERNGYLPLEGNEGGSYLTSGDSDDWLYGNTSCLPFTIELTTTYQPPATDILPLCEDNLGAALYAIDISAETEASKNPDWTFMVYMSGDNNLATEAISDLNEMEDVGSTDEVNIIALYDGQVTGDSKLYRILKDNASYNAAIISEVLDDGGQVIDPVTNEVDMTDLATMRSFIDWTMLKYPAQKYVLDFWGHGNGILSGFCPDGPRVTNAYSLSETLDGLDLDIVGFDTCSMGQMEVAYELMDSARIYVGSEALEPIAGWDYIDTLTTLINGPNIIPETLAVTIVADYLTKYPTKDYVTMAAVDLLSFKFDFLPVFDEFLNVSLDFVYSDYKSIWAARNISNTFEVSKDPLQQAVDLFGYLHNLKGQPISQHVKDRLERLGRQKDNLIIKSGHGSLYSNTDSLAIYFPPLEIQLSTNYYLFDFLDELWDEYLSAGKSPQPLPEIAPGVIPVPDNTTGPYTITASVTDYSGAEISVIYKTNNGTWTTLVMNNTAGQFTASIPGTANGTVIEWYFQAETPSRIITHPYEVKWGAREYYNMTVFASCEIGIYEISLTGNGTYVNGDIINITVKARNNGTESASVNFTIIMIGANGSVTLGIQQYSIGPGTNLLVNFTWTTVQGSWTILASAIAIGVYDTDPTNQNETVALNVEPSGSTDIVDDNVLGGMVGILFILALISLVPVFMFAYLMRDMKRKRRARAARQVKLAREMIRTAEEFDAETTESNILLAKAEVALAKGKLENAERLSMMARESAMDAVGERK